MYMLLQCVGEAVVEKGVRGLASMIPLGEVLYDIAECAWRKYREQCKDTEQRREFECLAVLSVEEAKLAAIEATKAANCGSVGASAKDIENLEYFLARIPETIRAAFQRPDDRTGRTIPPGFELVGSDDLLQLLPRFRPGIPLPGDEHWILDRQLGTGGFGEVWLAHNRDSAKLFGAVKFFRNLRPGYTDASREADQVIEVSKKNPANIVQVLGMHLHGDTPWILFEYVAGGGSSGFHNKAQELAHRRAKKTNNCCAQATGSGGRPVSST